MTNIQEDYFSDTGRYPVGETSIVFGLMLDAIQNVMYPFFDRGLGACSQKH